MHTGVSAGQVPQPRDAPQPSSIAPHCTPSQVAGMHVVVVLEVVETTLPVELVVGGAVVVTVVVGVIAGSEPQYGGVGLLLDWHTFLSALCFWAHTDRQARPALAFGHAFLHSLSCVPSAFLQTLGHRPASAVAVSNTPRRIAMTTRIEHSNRVSGLESPRSSQDGD
jgi:hypothetical protein